MGTKYQGSEKEVLALDTFIKLVRCVNALMSRIAENNPLPGKMTLSQFGILEALLHCGPMNQQELGRKILKSKGDITMVVENLMKAGLVIRERDPEDRRHLQVSLSDKGRKIIGDFFPSHAKTIAEEMNVLSKDKQELLGRLCRKLGVRQTNSG